MTWPSARYKSAAADGVWGPIAMNGVQDWMIRAAGLEQADFAEEIVGELGSRLSASLGSLGKTVNSDGNTSALLKSFGSIVIPDGLLVMVVHSVNTMPDGVVVHYVLEDVLSNHLAACTSDDLSASGSALVVAPVTGDTYDTYFAMWATGEPGDRVTTSDLQVWAFPIAFDID